MRRIRLRIAIVLSLCVSRAALCQDPNSFYDRGYAAAPNVGGAALQGDSLAVPSTPQAHVVGSEVLQQGHDPSDGAGEDEDAVAQMSVDLFVNSQDKAHFATVMQSVKQLLSNKRVRLSSISHLGDYRSIDQSTKDLLRSSGVAILGRSSLPSDLKVSSSPTWVLRNVEGRFIVEGTTEVARFVGPLGEFVMPVAQTPVPTPEAKIAGF